MNIIEKRKGQLKTLGIILLAIAAAALIGGILMCALSANAILIVIGVVLILLAVAGAVVGVIFTWVSSAVKATQGSIAEDNLGIGTVNMHKCENCGVAVEEGVKICKKCEENLKP